MALKDRFQTAAGIPREMSTSYDANASSSTVSRGHGEIGLFARSPAKKSLISLKNKKVRFSSAEDHELCTDYLW